MGWKYGSGKVNKPTARWANLFFLISLAITATGFNSMPVLWVLSLGFTPFLGVYFLMNIQYGLPKVFDYIVLWIYEQIKKLVKRFR